MSHEPGMLHVATPEPAMRPFVHRVDPVGADACAGGVVVAPAKVAWNGGLLLLAVVFAPRLATPSAVAMFLLLTYATLLLGHSVGMHRRFIHRSFDCPKWLERTLVYLGVVVGMAGPFGILRVHDVRDWAQREPACHDFFSHRRPLWVDALWQLTCRFEFAHPPRFVIEPEFADDTFYRWLERTWMLQQLPVALVLFAVGGWAWVVWGVCVRVVVSVTGHWVVTYLTHNPGPGEWLVPGAGVQAPDLPGCGLFTMGECWHNNHHAFPESARIGLAPGQHDPAWWVIRAFEHIGWATRVGLPRDEDQREDLVPRVT
jgi:stearoyl-CoA desaturase (delta-9 desaturase)